MKTARLIGALLSHRACGADVAGSEKPDAGQGYVLFFRQTIDDHTEHAIERALLTHFEQQALKYA